MRFVAFAGSDGKIIYVNPEHVMMVRPPIGQDPQSNALIVVGSGAFYAVRENVEEVMKLLGASQ
jgi:hypothetical protein